MSECRFQLQGAEANFALHQNKILVGSDPRCDWVINHPSISALHACLVVSSSGVTVIDLVSHQGTFIQGRRITQGVLFVSETLSFGEVTLTLNEAAGVMASVENSTSLQAPPLQLPGMTLVDDEYCYLELNTDLSHNLSRVQWEAEKDRAPISEENALTAMDEAYDILNVEQRVRLECMWWEAGQLFDVEYIELTNGQLALSSETKKGTLFFAGLKQDVPLIRQQAGKWWASAPEGMTLTYDGEEVKDGHELTGEWLMLTFGTHQLSLRLVESQYQIRPLPMFLRDRAFMKDSAKIVAGLFLPFLLLLFVTLPVPEPEQDKIISIVYKTIQPTESTISQEASGQQVTQTQENTGHKQTQQQPEKVQMAASAPAPSKSQPQNPAPAAAAAANKPKAFEFKSSFSLDGVTAADTSHTKSNGRSPASVANSAAQASTSALNGVGAGSGDAIGKLGSDATGSGAESFGAKGVVAKKGFDHSYLEPKTVVLGSMDPELLRRILQEYLPQFRHCYQQELVGAAEAIKGVIDLDFQIDPAGRAGRIAIKAKDARFSRKGVDCMAQVLRIIDFPKPKGGGVVDVRQPLNFFAETEKI